MVALLGRRVAHVTGLVLDENGTGTGAILHIRGGTRTTKVLERDREKVDERASAITRIASMFRGTYICRGREGGREGGRGVHWEFFPPLDLIFPILNFNFSMLNTLNYMANDITMTDYILI